MRPPTLVLVPTPAGVMSKPLVALGGGCHPSIPTRSFLLGEFKESTRSCNVVGGTLVVEDGEYMLCKSNVGKGSTFGLVLGGGDPLWDISLESVNARGPLFFRQSTPKSVTIV